jgi:hypothetical protein
VQVRVRSDAAGPLAIRMLNPSDMTPSEIFVNGALVGQTGSFPPHVQVDDFPRTTVFALPAGLTAPGETATVAFRVWSSCRDQSPRSRCPAWKGSMIR